MAELRYPSEREADIVLRDGSTVHVRPVRGEDAEAIRAFLDGISPESIAFRFFGMPNLKWVADWSVDVDYADRFALVAETGTPRRIVAHAAYVRDRADRAEVAFLVSDPFQGQGISTILLAHLAAAAEGHGITTFVAQVLPANHRMIEVFRGSGFPVDLRARPDAIEVEMPTSLSPAGLARFEERERLASVAAVRGFLEPRSVAVIGASRRRDTIGGQILHNLLLTEFNGPVYAVNAEAEVVQSLPAYRSVLDLPVRVDLAVVVVPADQVLAIARECATARVRALLVISSGFAETGLEGEERQRQLLAVCREAGIRIVGPNCLGVINTAPGVRLNATFAPRPALPGPVGFMSQSGGLGIPVIEAAERIGVGLSSFVAVGNKADISGNDLLSYWESDPRTEVGLLYLESFGNPRRFARLAPRFARRKPLLAVTSGRSSAGARATASHTGALIHASGVTVDALFEQAGVIRTDTLHELFAVAQLLISQPVPRGDRVAIVANAAGPGIMCADACQAEGVDVPELETGLQERLRASLPAGASVPNPIDVTATASAADFGRTIEALIGADACDAVLTVFVPSLATEPEVVAEAIRQVAEQSVAVPIATVFMTEEGPPPELGGATLRVPGYEFPEDAARAVALAAKYGRWRAAPEPEPARLDQLDPEGAAAVISGALAAGGGWLPPGAVGSLLRCYGLGLVGPAAGRAADAPSGEGVELLVGVVHDQNFGPVVACGAGGPIAELIQDVAVRITPLSEHDARQMVRSLKTFPLLDGYRGSEPCDVAAVENVLLRVGAMVEAHREIAELDLRPLIASPGGALIGDARVRVEAVAAPRPVSALGA